AWRESRKVMPAPVVRPFWKTPAFALTLTLCLVMVGNGIRPSAVSAQSVQSARLVWAGTDADFTGQPSRDSRFLTFTDWTQFGNLGVRDLITGRSRFLTHSKTGTDGYGDGSVPSPDGRFIAYRWTERGFSLRVIPSSGGGPKILPWGAGSTYG